MIPPKRVNTTHSYIFDRMLFPILKTFPRQFREMVGFLPATLDHAEVLQFSKC